METLYLFLEQLYSVRISGPYFILGDIHYLLITFE